MKYYIEKRLRNVVIKFVSFQLKGEKGDKGNDGRDGLPGLPGLPYAGGKKIESNDILYVTTNLLITTFELKVP